MLRDLDARYPKNYRPSYKTFFKLQSQALVIRFYPASKNIQTRIQSQPRHAAMRWSQLRWKISRKSSNSVDKSRINKPQLLAAIPRPYKRKKRSVTQTRSLFSSAIRKATMPATALNQKTSISLSNYCADD